MLELGVVQFLFDRAVVLFVSLSFCLFNLAYSIKVDFVLVFGAILFSFNYRLLIFLPP